jgi:glycosyltransferase involved in cell wall biosynthesis
LIKHLKLGKKVKFTGFQKNIENFLNNASLHIFPSISECYPMALVEAKLYGIPTILCGLDYLSLAKGGTVIIYDDNPDTIAKQSIKILKNETYRKQLGKEARESMKNHKNDLIAKKWIKLLLSVYKGDDKSFMNLNAHNIMTREESKQILNNQLLLLKRRYHRFKRLTLEKLESYSLK